MDGTEDVSLMMNEGKIMLNNYYQNIGLKGFLQRYGIMNAIKRGFFMANPMHRVKNYEVKKVLWQSQAAEKVKSYLKYKETNVDNLEFLKDITDEPVWVFWDKGIENAPLIVQKCIKSIQTYSSREVVLLDNQNLSEYIIFPEYIESKRKSGQIPMAGYSDLIRFALLEHYGGTWIDATVYLTDYLPEHILNSDFFAFRNSLLLIENPVLFPAWFLHAKKGNKTMREIRNVAFAYWMKNNHVIEYLLPNLIITQILKVDPDAEKKIPYMNSDYSEYLIKMLPEKYSEERYEWVKKLTCIHKLSYKLDPKINAAESVYQHILMD